MKAVFADSSFYVALLVARDRRHAAARQLAESWTGFVVTTDYVLLEVANHLRSSQRREKFGTLIFQLRADPNCEIVPSGHVLWNRGLELYLRRPDKQWSLTDCISFVVMEERTLQEALTADHHFEQAGFATLLR